MSLKLTQKQFEEKVRKNNPHKIEIIGEYNGNKNKIKARCINGHEFYGWPYDLANKANCPYCSNRRALKGFNTFGDKYPDLIKYFKNSEEAYNYVAGSEEFVDFVCPNCGNIVRRTLCDFRRRGIQCNKCSDGISVPNKFIRNIILLRKDILEDYKFEYGPKWEGLGRRKFDAYFKYNGETYIVEMDGKIHETGWKGNGDGDKIKENDKYKQDLAIKNGINNFIRIDAYTVTLENLIKNFIGSGLNKIFNINNDEFNEIWKICQNSVLKQVCEDYKNDPYIAKKELAEKYFVDVHTILVYLKRGNELGLCNYKPMSGRRKGAKLINEKTKDEKIFDTLRECCKYLKNEGIECYESTIQSYVKKHKSYNGYLISWINEK